MDLRACFAIFKRWWWLLCLCIIVATGTAAILSFFYMDKVYESKATIIVKSPESLSKTSGSYLPSSNLIKIYYNLMVSETVMQSVKEWLNLSEPLEDIRKMIKVDPDFDTGIIQITARNTDSVVSKNIAMTLINSLKEEADKIKLNHIIHIIDVPKLTEKPVQPKPFINIGLSFVSGGMLGLLTIMIVHSMDHLVKEIPILRRFKNIPILGQIPRFKASYINWLISNKQVVNHVDESYKVLRTHVMHHLKDSHIKTILITSAGSEEGKTMTATNLASSFAHLGYKVLLMDADFKTSDMKRYFKLCKLQGLTHYYFKKEQSFEGCPVSNTGLDVMCDGLKPADPTVILESDRFKSQFNNLRATYDMIIIDGSAMPMAADALILSQLVDGVIVVSNYRRLNYDALNRVKRTLEEVGAKILGFVVNKIPYKSQV